MTSFPTWPQTVPTTAFPMAATNGYPSAAYPMAAAVYPTTSYSGFGPGFALPFPDAAGLGMSGNAIPGPVPIASERFIQAFGGGVLLGADGKPTGKVPEGSFVDTTDGTIYGPDGKAVNIPAGGSVDLFDLPDIATLVAGGPSGAGSLEAQVQAGLASVADPSMNPDAGGAPQKYASAPPQKYPSTATPTSGVLAASGGAADAMAGCGDMMHGVAATTSSTAAAGTSVAGASGAGAAANTAPQKQITTGNGLIEGVAPSKVAGASGPGMSTEAGGTSSATATLAASTTSSAPGKPAAAGTGGTSAAAAGAAKIGTVPTLQSSLDELIATIKQLATAINNLAARGGATIGAAPQKGPAPEKGTPTTTAGAAPYAPAATGGGAAATTETVEIPPTAPPAMPAPVAPVAAPPVTAHTAVPGAPPSAAIGFTPDAAPPVAPTVA